MEQRAAGQRLDNRAEILRSKKVMHVDALEIHSHLPAVRPAAATELEAGYEIEIEIENCSTSSA